jgi:hypothetical protein
MLPICTVFLFCFTQSDLHSSVLLLDRLQIIQKYPCKFETDLQFEDVCAAASHNNFVNPNIQLIDLPRSNGCEPIGWDPGIVILNYSGMLAAALPLTAASPYLAFCSAAAAPDRRRRRTDASREREGEGGREAAAGGGRGGGGGATAKRDGVARLRRRENSGPSPPRRPHSPK